MTDISPNPGLGLPDDASGPFGSAWARSASLAEFAAQRVPWKRVLKFAAGLTLLGFGAITTYEQVIVRVSREAVVNARVLSVRAPIDGVLHSTKAVPGAGVTAGTPIAQVDDPVPDNARLFQLQLDAAAAQRERETFARKLTDLQQARAAALATSEAFRLGRIRQDEVRIEEARATLAAATVRQTEAGAAEQRGAILHERGYLADQGFEKLTHAREVTQHEAVAARKRMEALTVELEAAKRGTYLGDNYNDVPSSYQRASELAVRIEEAKASIDELTQKAETLALRIADEQKRVAAQSRAALSVPVNGNLWTVQAGAGEYVRKGQELFTALDCSTVIVTGSVSERDYNEVRLGDPVRFRVAGTDRVYHGEVTQLGLTATGRSWAISPEERHHQVGVHLIDMPSGSPDTCAVGRTGQLVFDGHGSGTGGRLIEGLRHLLGRG
jgi:multidrug resistance efflux pump